MTGSRFIGFKVISFTNKNRKRMVSLIEDGRSAVVDYKVDEWVNPRPGCGPLCIFDTSKNAEEFAWFQCGYATKVYSIYKCEYIPSESNYAWTIEGRRSTISYFPAGTIFADKVMLLKDVSDSAKAKRTQLDES